MDSGAFSSQRNTHMSPSESCPSQEQQLITELANKCAPKSTEALGRQALSHGLRSLFAWPQWHSQFELLSPSTVDWKIDMYFSLFWRLDIQDQGTFCSGSSEGPLPGCHILMCAHKAEGGQRALWGSFYKGTNPQRPPPNTTTLGVKISKPESPGGHKHSVHCTQCAIQMLLLFTCARTWNMFGKHMPVFPCLSPNLCMSHCCLS